MARFPQIALLFIFIGFFQSSAIPSCPYEGQTLQVSKSLVECLEEAKYQALTPEHLMRCYVTLTPSGQPNPKAVFFENTPPGGRYQALPKENYKRCAPEFNKLLDAIMAARVDIEKEEERIKTAAQARKNMPKSEIVKEAIQYQKDICEGKVEYFTKEKDKKITSVKLNFRGSPFTMFVYKENDIVSTQIRQSGSWENSQLHQVGAIMEKYQKSHMISDPSQMTFLDIGAQVGWYMTNLAAKGYKVVAFEPMADNEYLVRKNICANPKSDIIYLNKALGNEDQICYLYSENKNKGDPGLFCGGSSPNHPAYFNRGAVEVHKLDDFTELFENVIVVKMDIEGFEHNVIRGGRNFIFERRIPYIQSEFAPKMLREKGGDPREYLLEYIKAGYSVSRVGFEVEFLTPVQIEELALIDGIIDIFFTHGDLIDTL